jgi:hypothetical protein
MAGKTSYHNLAVRQLILLRETGPKSAAWHRARVQLIWRLHRQIEQEARADTAPTETHPIPNPPEERAESD